MLATVDNGVGRPQACFGRIRAWGRPNALRESTPKRLPAFNHRDARAVLCAFDLLEVSGEDIRCEPIEDRKRRLAGLLRLPHEGIALNEAFTGDGGVIFKHACALGCEGIVSKRLGSPYRAGRSAHWLKVKNLAAPAMPRLEEEDWR
jgi:ATP-dependent DNA ligase